MIMAMAENTWKHSFLFFHSLGISLVSSTHALLKQLIRTNHFWHLKGVCVFWCWNVQRCIHCLGFAFTLNSFYCNPQLGGVFDLMQNMIFLSGICIGPHALLGTLHCAALTLIKSHGILLYHLTTSFEQPQGYIFRNMNASRTFGIMGYTVDETDKLQIQLTERIIMRVGSLIITSSASNINHIHISFI